MPRVLVIAEGPEREVVMDEWVEPEHVESRHSAEQLIERLSWGVHDAANVEKLFTSKVAPKGQSRSAFAPERLHEEAGTRSYLEV
jgi:hypothetical protein